MAERPERTVRIREFSGLVSNRGAFAGKPGDAKLLKNCHIRAPGQLEVRGGLRKVRFVE